MNNVNIFTAIGGTGYGVAGLNFIKHLDANITLFTPNNTIRTDSKEDTNLIQKCIDNQETFDYDAPFLKIWHQFDLALRVGRGKYYAYPFFELDKFNKRQKHHLGFPDTILVSSKWAKNIINNQIPNKQCEIVNCGVDVSIFNKDNVNTNFNIRSNKDNFVFINIGKWEKRKGHDILIECFNQAFLSSDSVELWMVTDNPFLNATEANEWQSLYKNSRLGQKVKIFSRLPKHSDIASLINLSNCVILPSRAEGWNLEALEAMACGKPLIITNYSAHTEYCNQQNSYLVDIDTEEKAEDGKWFHGEGNWASIQAKQKEQIIEYMRSVYKQFIFTGIPENTAGIETAKRFSWENATKQLQQVLFNQN